MNLKVKARRGSGKYCSYFCMQSSKYLNAVKPLQNWNIIICFDPLVVVFVFFLLLNKTETLSVNETTSQFHFSHNMFQKESLTAFARNRIFSCFRESFSNRTIDYRNQ